MCCRCWWEFVLLSVHRLGVTYSVLVLSVLAGEAVCGTLLVLNALLIVLFFFRAFMEFVDVCLGIHGKFDFVVSLFLFFLIVNTLLTLPFVSRFFRTPLGFFWICGAYDFRSGTYSFVFVVFVL